MNKLLSVISFIILATPQFAIAQQTYYIDPNGYELGNGTAERPWKSLYKACQMVTTSGSIIHVNPGTYVENQTCILSPGVSIEGSDAEECIITSTSITAQFTAIIDMRSSTITNGNQSISNITFDGNKTTIAQAFNIVGRSNVNIHDCIFKDFHYMVVWWTGLMSNNKPVYASNNSFHDNIVTNCADYSQGYARGALMLGGQEKMLIYNNYISQKGRPAGENGWPLKVWANEGYIKDSKIYNNVLYKDDITYWDFCIEMNYVSGLEIYNNSINGSLDTNYQFKGDYDYSIYIHDNTIGYETPQSRQNFGICLEFTSENVIIRNNLIKNVDVGINFSTRDDSHISNFEASYNIIHNIDHTATSPYGGLRVLEAGTTLTDFKVFNNVFVANPNNRAFSGIEFRRGGWTSVSGIKIMNNIFMNFNYWFFTHLPGTAYNDLRIENNILFNNGINNGEFFNAGTPTSLTKRNNINANPLFVSSTNYHLQENSPGVDAGLYIEEMTSDMEGILVANPPNIGAYETVGSDIIPVIDGASIDGNPSSITITYNIALAQVTPSTSAFEVKLNNSVTEVTAVSIENGNLVLSINAEAKAGDILTISYTKPEDNTLQSVSGKEAPSYSNYPILNLLLSLNDINNANLLIYPNPTSDIVHFSFSGDIPHIVSYRIINMNGQELSRDKLPTNAPQEVALHLKDGIYIVQIMDNNKVLTAQKIIIHK